MTDTDTTTTGTTAARGRVKVETSGKRVRALVGGQVVADTTGRCWSGRCPYYPTYYLPAGRRAGRARADRRDRALAEPRRRPRCYVVRVDGDAARRRAALPRLADRGAARRRPLRLGRDGRVAGGGRAGLHPPAQTRTRASTSSPAAATCGSSVDGVTLAESHQPRILFETGLPPRYYLPMTDVRPRPAAAVRPADPLPVQGDGDVLVASASATASTRTSSGSTGRRCRRARRSPACLLLRREARRRPGRRPPARTAEPRPVVRLLGPDGPHPGVGRRAGCSPAPSCSRRRAGR